MKAKSSFIFGFLTTMPLLSSSIVSGVAAGAVAFASNMDYLTLIIVSVLVNSGIAQMIITTDFQHNAVSGGTFLIVLISSFRLIFYSLDVGGRIKSLRVHEKIFVGLSLSDAVYFSLKDLNVQKHRNASMCYFGAFVADMLVWMVFVGVGYHLGDILGLNRIPGIDFPLLAILMSILVVSIRTSMQFVSAIAAALFSLLCFSLPYQLGVILPAMVAGFGVYVLMRLGRADR